MLMNTAPARFDAQRELPPGFLEKFLPLHRAFTPRQQVLVRKRGEALIAAQRGDLPQHLPASEASTGAWKIALPAWITDQRNQMTGPADDAELVVKMLNSGAPGVMLDLEDSMANFFPNTLRGVSNVLQALSGDLRYTKRGKEVGIKPSATVTFTRVRGLHLNQVGVIYGEPCSASLFDLCMVALQVDAAKLAHPLSFYIPKSESAEEALWWNDVLKVIAKLRGWAPDYIKCMALVESHPLAYQMEEFIYGLRDHLIGLNLGRWDYMASLIHFNLADPGWVLPDRNTIPSDVPFFQNLRNLLPEICHKRGIFAIGGMTALYPSREDPELNARALAVLEKDKKNEADSLMDGAWTGHPDQNAIAVRQFPEPNQLGARRANVERYPDLRPKPARVGHVTIAGTRAAVRCVIGYRHGVLNGRGASLLDGYMEDLATDRIYRLMIAQRVMHGVIAEDGTKHTAALVSQIFDEELVRLQHDELSRLQRSQIGNDNTWRDARRMSEAMIVAADIDPT